MHSIGTESTCVHDVECELLWVYRGDSSACATLTAVFTDPDGNVVQTADILDNDGQVTQVVSGDATVSEYTLTLTCDGDASVTDSIDFQVSYSSAPTMMPSSSWPSAVPSALPSTGPSPSPSIGATDVDPQRRADARPHAGHGVPGNSSLHPDGRCQLRNGRC